MPVKKDPLFEEAVRAYLQCVKDRRRRTYYEKVLADFVAFDTYAQNLLESGQSIFEIMQMLGHDRVKSSRSYLHVHVTLMRKVLFDETL